MAQSREFIPVRIHLAIEPNGAPAAGQIELLSWDRKDRLKRAAQGWLLCWGGAIAFIPIPLVHMIAIPVLLIAGPIVGSVMYGQKEVFLGGSGTCPGCNAPLTIARSKVSWPLTDLCSAC